jgi:hypothetical protein
MRNISWLIVLSALLSCQKTSAQIQPPLAPDPQPQGPQQPVQQFYVEDGGTSEVLESIVIPPKAQAPFTLQLETEWVKTLSDGGTSTLVNKRRIARDSEGRIYQERWFLVPKKGKGVSRMTTIQIADPNKHIYYNCFMNRKQQCTMGTFTGTTNSIYKFQGPPSGPLPDDMGFAIHEDLGQQVFAGLETTGTRDKITYNPGVLGNDQIMTIEREFWFSPQLGFNLLSKRSDPRIGTQTFTVTSLTTSEPDPNLFNLPDGFTVADQRQTAPPEN